MNDTSGPTPPPHQPPSGQQPNQPSYGPPPGQPPYGPPASQPPYGSPAGQPPYGTPAGQPHYGPPLGQPPYGPPAGQPPYGPPPGGQYPPPGGYYPSLPLTEQDARMWASAAHWAPLVLFVMSAGLLTFAAPLVIWLAFRRRSWLVDDQAKEALNFQITLVIAAIVGVITFVFVVGAIILIAAFILSLVFCIQGAMRAYRGEPYRYPICLRFVK